MSTLASKKHQPTLSIEPPAPPLPDNFRDIPNNRAILDYFQVLRRQFLYANNLGMALDDDDLGADRRPVLLDNLFVPPMLSDSHILPETIASLEIRGGKPQLRELYQLLCDRPRVFILGDPGTGKSTLIAWLVLALTYSGDNHVKGALGPLVPFPIVLRDLDLHKVDTWGALWNAWRARTPQALSEELEQALCESGQALFLIDGIDEISAPALRAGLGRALLDGMNRCRKCRFVFTSRIVGFSLTALFNLPKPEEAEALNRSYSDMNSVMMEKRAKSTPGDLFVSYLAPFNLSQVERFVRNWYGQYETNAALHSSRLQDLIVRLGKNDGLSHLSRIPVLLNMICFIHARRLRLPDGRAELYSRIAETYLVALDRARGLRFQGRELEVDYHDLGSWLAQLALRMQKKRGGEDDTVLADRIEVEEVLRQGLAEKGLSPEEVSAQAGFVLDYLAQRSGFLIPRGRKQGREQYAFSHLSFQEYFAARALAEQLMFMEKKDWQEWRENLKKTQWREPFILLFELLTTVRQVESLAKQLYGENLEYLNAAQQDDPEPYTGWVLLAQVAMDTAVRLGNTARTQMIDAAWSKVLDAEKIFTPISSYDALTSALWKEQFASLERFTIQAANKKTERLRLSGCESLNNLTPLAELKQLLALDIEECTQVSDLTPLAELNHLTVLGLTGSQVSDLAPLARLKALKLLALSLTPVRDLTPLASLKQLEFLEIARTQVDDIAPLVGIERLNHLYLSYTRVSDFTPLASLTHLRKLSLSFTQVSDLIWLAGLTHLDNLDLSNTQVIDLAPLADLTHLNYLNLSNTQVSDLAPLAGLTHLNYLNLSNTQVSDLTPLSRLKELEFIDLSLSQVPDTSCLPETVKVKRHPPRRPTTNRKRRARGLLGR